VTSLLPLVSSACWGTADFLAGLKARELPLLTVVLISQGFGLLVGIAIVVLRRHGPPGVEALAAGAAAGITGVVGLAALYQGLAVGTMSIVAPIAGTAVVVPVAVGLLRGERPSAIQFAGMALALAGVVLAAREPGGDGARRVASGVGLALVAAVALGATFVFLDAAGDADVGWAGLTIRATSFSILVLVALVVRPPIRGVRRDLGVLAAVGILDNGANVLFTIASSQGLLSVAAVLGSLYPVGTVALARFVLRERVSRVQSAGVVAALVGVVLIAR
jgi:drug/metabolite transporter (DMT)-like permease